MACEHSARDRFRKLSPETGCDVRPCFYSRFRGAPRAVLFPENVLHGVPAGEEAETFASVADKGHVEIKKQ